MSSKRLNIGSKDYISGLPDCLISHHILSFLSTKEAASTCVLAKRWRYLFALTPNLDLDDSIYLNPKKGNRKKKNKVSRSFVDFVDRVLVLRQNVPISRFSLKCDDAVHRAIITSWLLKVMKRGVLDLDLHISSGIGYSLPSEMFLNETLVRLRLGASDVITIRMEEDVFLPNVKTLCLDYVMVYDSEFAKLLSGCPKLKELVLDNLFEVTGTCSVSHNTIERLVVGRYEISDENLKTVSFCTPNVVYLEYSDALAYKYTKIDFNSLVEARIDLHIPADQKSAPEEMVGDATNFFMGICNVKILYLSEYTLEVLTYCCKQIPEFKNLIHLTIKTDIEVSWESLPALLKKCPNLETLVFEGFHLQIDLSWWTTSNILSSNSVKVLKILHFGDVFGDEYNEEMQIQFILETMPNLEQLIIYYDACIDVDVNELLAQLQCHPRASSKCKIQVISDDLCLSTTVPSSVTNK